MLARLPSLDAVGKVQDTRATMLEAAIEVIEAGGTDAIRVREIAAAAGVSYASLYHYFGDREGLIEAAQATRYSRSVSDLLEELGERIARCRTRAQFREALVALIRRTFEPDRWRYRMDRASVLGSAQSRPTLLTLLAEAHRERDRQLAEIFRPARDRGWVRTDIPLDEIAGWFISIVSARVFIEMDPEHAGSAAWNALTEEALLNAVLAPAS